LTQESFFFVSDVHIAPGDEGRVRHFSGFLNTIEQKKADRLYILGDLFDYWVGPGHEEQSEYRAVLEKIRDVTDSGVEVFLLRGNRDFFIDSKVARIAGARMLGDDVNVPIDGKIVHLCHGDHLCQDDHTHQNLRKLVRIRLLRAVFRMLPMFVRERLALKLRGWSKQSAANRPSEVVGLSPHAIESVFEHGADVLICGHTHTHGRRVVQANGSEHVLYNLGDWSANGSYLLYENNKFELLHYEW